MEQETKKNKRSRDNKLNQSIETEEIQEPRRSGEKTNTQKKEKGWPQIKSSPVEWATRMGGESKIENEKNGK